MAASQTNAEKQRDLNYHNGSNQSDFIPERELVAHLLSLDNKIGSRGDGFFALSSDAGSITTLGGLMIAVDRELRRTVAQSRVFGDIPIAQSLKENRREDMQVEVQIRSSSDSSTEDTRPYIKNRNRLPAPAALAETGLRLSSAESGSGHFIFEVFGELQSLMTANPITALVNTVTLVGGFSQLRLYANHVALASRAFQESMKSTSGDPSQFLGRPTVELDLRADATMSLPDGTTFSGKTITYTTNHVDENDNKVQTTVEVR